MEESVRGFYLISRDDTIGFIVDSDEHFTLIALSDLKSLVLSTQQNTRPVRIPIPLVSTNDMVVPFRSMT